jgi:hypothetical protein
MRTTSILALVATSAVLASSGYPQTFKERSGPRPLRAGALQQNSSSTTLSDRNVRAWRSISSGPQQQSRLAAPCDRGQAAGVQCPCSRLFLCD